MSTAPQNIVGPEFLAPLLHRDVSTIKRDATRKPESLPPRLMIPGSSKLLWAEKDVWEWIESCRPKSDRAAPSPADQPVKRKPGRPPKLALAQLAR